MLRSRPTIYTTPNTRTSVWDAHRKMGLERCHTGRWTWYKPQFRVGGRRSIAMSLATHSVSRKRTMIVSDCGYSIAYFSTYICSPTNEFVRSTFVLVSNAYHCAVSGSSRTAPLCPHTGLQRANKSPPPPPSSRQTVSIYLRDT